MDLLKGVQKDENDDEEQDDTALAAAAKFLSPTGRTTLRTPIMTPTATVTSVSRGYNVVVCCEYGSILHVVLMKAHNAGNVKH